MQVSILIPCYNAERWIGAAIRSALEQAYPHKEVIVVDDGSTDGSLDVIRAFGSSIRWETGPNRGGNAARNRLLELSSGAWLQYLDADDYLRPDKITRQLADGGFESADVLYSPVIEEFWMDDVCLRQQTVAIPAPRDPWALLARWLLPQTGACLWRKSTVQAVGGWAPDQRCCQEHELYFRLLCHGAVFHYADTPDAVYRIWSQQTVCRRNPLETHLRRLDVIRRLETFLRARGELSDPRRAAIAHSRWEAARVLYELDPAAAIAIAREADRQCPGFRLPVADSFPWAYRTMHRVVGFAASERVAQLARRWRGLHALRKLRWTSPPFVGAPAKVTE